MNNEPLIEAMKYDHIKRAPTGLYLGDSAQPMDPPRNKTAVAAFELIGICVYLYEDGTWEWQDTTGG